MTDDHGEHHDHHVHDHKHADGTDCHCEPATDELSAIEESSAIDPVCGMTVDKGTTTLTADYGDERYYFCSPGCRTSFLANPKAYVG